MSIRYSRCWWWQRAERNKKKICADRRKNLIINNNSNNKRSLQPLDLLLVECCWNVSLFLFLSTRSLTHSLSHILCLSNKAIFPFEHELDERECESSECHLKCVCGSELAIYSTTSHFVRRAHICGRSTQVFSSSIAIVFRIGKRQSENKMDEKLGIETMKISFFFFSFTFALDVVVEKVLILNKCKRYR